MRGNKAQHYNDHNRQHCGDYYSNNGSNGQRYQRNSSSNNGGGNYFHNRGGGSRGFNNSNGRRPYQRQGEYYSNNQHYSQNGGGGNGYYSHHRNGTRGYLSESYHDYRRNNNATTPVTTPDGEEVQVWPSKRNTWGGPDNVMTGGGGSMYSASASSRNCSPDSSPTSDISGSFPPVSAHSRDVFGSGIISAQGIDPYEYFVANMQGQNNGANGFYPGGYGSGGYFYGYTPTSAVMDRENPSEGLSLLHVIGPPPPLATESNSSSRAESCAESPGTERTTDWPDDSSDGSNSDAAMSTRCQSPEDCQDIPILTHDPNLSLRFCNNYSVFPKEFSPASFFLRLQRRPGFNQCPSFPREWFDDIDPDEVIKQFGRVVDTTMPFSQEVESTFTMLDKAIWAKFLENRQTAETFRKKIELWRDIYRLVRFMDCTPDVVKPDPRNFPYFGLQVVGSTMSGFGSNSSDVDMCLVIRDTEVDQRYEAVERLQALSNGLTTLNCIENIEMIYAKVPILKFKDCSRRLDVDLNCNNFVGIRNTHLLYAYAQMDWRLKPLVLIVKLWAQFHGINDAKMMTISSYSLVLMVIHFLQHGLEEPVLPNLHKLFPDKFNNTIPIVCVKIHEEFSGWASKNTMGLGELLTLFLEYYGRKFDYSRNVISVRMGGTIPIKQAANFKSYKNDYTQWKLLCVEEPFDRTNTARSVYEKVIFERILAIFFASWQKLATNQTLNSIFSPITEDELRPLRMMVAAKLR